MVISKSDINASKCLQTAPTYLFKVPTTTALNANQVTTSIIVMVVSNHVTRNMFKKMAVK